MTATDSCGRSFVAWNRRRSMPTQTWSGQLAAVNSTALEGDHSSGGSPTSLPVRARKLNISSGTSPGTGHPVIQPSLKRRSIPIAYKITRNLKWGIGHGCEAAGCSARQCVASVTNHLVSRFVESLVATVGIRKQPYRLSDQLFELLSASVDLLPLLTG